VFAATVAVSFVFFGVIIIPGVLLLVAVFGAIDRPASVAVTNRGVAVLARSGVNGGPSKLLTVLPAGVLADPTVSRSGSYVHLPSLHLWFRKKEYERLLGATNGNSVPRQWAAPLAVGVAAGIPGDPGPRPAAPSGAVAVATSPVRGAMPGSQAVPAENESGVIYCSWCGKQRAVNAAAIHYCGSMERPAVYCMKCGTSFAEGATACTSCGTPATQLSR
jgi:hypothetical protein